MAAAMVEEFRRMTSELVITEAQQRRSFFEKQVQATRDKLTAAQQALQSSGLTAGTLKAEPKAAAEGYAKLKAEATAAQVRLQALLTNLTANAPEVQQQQSLLAALNAELRKQEANVSQQDADSGYIGKYREFKYQEVLFELFLRQYEMARLDEGREGGLTQVVDVAQVPEKKSKPKRAFIGLGASVAAGLVLLVFVLIRAQLRMSDASGEARAKLAKLLPALVGRG
jgi:capsule polysaccharide export protein KpsE/RkpR